MWKIVYEFERYFSCEVALQTRCDKWCCLLPQGYVNSIAFSRIVYELLADIWSKTIYRSSLRLRNSGIFKMTILHERPLLCSYWPMATAMLNFSMTMRLFWWKLFNSWCILLSFCFVIGLIRILFPLRRRVNSLWSNGRPRWDEIAIHVEVSERSWPSNSCLTYARGFSKSVVVFTLRCFKNGWLSRQHSQSFVTSMSRSEADKKSDSLFTFSTLFCVQIKNFVRLYKVVNVFIKN